MTLACILHVSAQTPSVIATPAYKLTFEKTYLHTDRDIYAPGDTLWFKAYLLNAQDNKLANSSNNLYTELISPDAKLISSEMIRLDKGLGTGDFYLPDSLVAGTYRLRAYTNWMRNFGDNFIFEKQFTVLNDDAAAPVATDKKVAATGKNKKAETASIVVAPAPATLKTATINFFPEGGLLLEGVNSFVGVKAEDGKPASGAVISSAGDTVAHFTCDSLGMGMFGLLPFKGLYYRVVVKGISYPLPAALSKGLSLQVRNTDTLLRVVISRSDTSFKYTVITVRHAGMLILSQRVDFSASQVAAKIPINGLPEGICAITLYDDQNRPQCERLIYIHHAGFGSLVSVKPDKTIYAPKEQMSLTISAEPNTSLSLAVADATTTDAFGDNIASALMLSSELRGHIDNPARYFDTTNINRFKQLDLLLMTQGWRNFVWRRLADTTLHISYAAEKDVVVSGKIEDEIGHKPMPDLFVTLRAEANKGAKLFDGVTDDAGHFAITGLNMYGKQSVNLTSTSGVGAGKRTGTFIMDTLTRPPVRLITKNLALKEDTIAANSFQKKTIAMQKAKIKGVTHLKEVKVKGRAPVILYGGDILTTLGYPDQVFDIKPEDEQYKTLEWYLMQKGNGIQKSSMLWHDIIPTGIEIAGLDTAFNLSPEGSIAKDIPKYRLIPPQIFVNGKELNMTEATQAESYRIQYFYMPLNKFKKIVLKHMVGTFHGIAYRGNNPGIPLDGKGYVDRYLLYLTMIDNYEADNPGYKTANIEGYYQARTFYQPPVNAKPSLADYRSTIHWEPNIKTDASGKATVSFYNAISETAIKVMVQGITDKGIPVSTTMNYTVGNK